MSKWFVIYMDNQQLITLGCDSYSLALYRMSKCKSDNKNCKLFYGTKEEARRVYESP